MMFVPILLMLAFVALFVVTTWKIFEKAGVEGWKSIIPIYNVIVFLEIIGKPWWWIFLMCVPIANYVFIIWAFNMFSKSFGKDEGFTALLFFFSFIFFPVIAFGDAQYIGPYGDPAAFAEYQGRRTAFDFESQQMHNNTGNF